MVINQWLVFTGPHHLPHYCWTRISRNSHLPLWYQSCVSHWWGWSCCPDWSETIGLGSNWRQEEPVFKKEPGCDRLWTVKTLVIIVFSFTYLTRIPLPPHTRVQCQQQNSEQSNQHPLNYVFSEIPDWRVDMKDTLACHSPLLTSAENDGNVISLFGVFDSHGDGGFASRYIAQELASTFLHHYHRNYTISSDKMN